MLDVVAFLLLAVKYMRSQKRWPSKSTTTFLDDALVVCLRHVATYLQIYVESVYCVAHDVSGPPPSKSIARPAGAPVRCS